MTDEKVGFLDLTTEKSDNMAYNLLGWPRWAFIENIRVTGGMGSQLLAVWAIGEP